jgi:hypothetical protein
VIFVFGERSVRKTVSDANLPELLRHHFPILD